MRKSIGGRERRTYDGVAVGGEEKS